MLQKQLGRIVLVFIAALAFYLVSFLVLTAKGFTGIEILRDPAQQTNTSSFLGFLSNVGIWLWVSAAAVYFFAYVQSAGRATGRSRELILLLGVLSLLLATDDFFMIHDRYVNEKICYLFYAVVALSILARHFRTLFQWENLAFFIAAGLMGMSIFVDMSQKYLTASWYENLQILEEGCKFVGGAMCLYFAGKLGGEVLRGY